MCFKLALGEYYFPFINEEKCHNHREQIKIFVYKMVFDGKLIATTAVCLSSLIISENLLTFNVSTVFIYRLKTCCVLIYQT